MSQAQANVINGVYSVQGLQAVLLGEGVQVQGPTGQATSRIQVISGAVQFVQGFDGVLSILAIDPISNPEGMVSLFEPMVFGQPMKPMEQKPLKTNVYGANPNGSPLIKFL
jgi:hypothetical protein